MLAGEPWCFAPDVIAGLTDYQILHVYIRPAAERAARLRREAGDPDGTDTAPPASDEPEGVRQGAMWDYLTVTLGMSPEEAERAINRE